MKHFISVFLIISLAFAVVGCAFRQEEKVPVETAAPEVSTMPDAYQDILVHTVALIDCIGRGEYDGHEELQYGGIVEYTLACGVNRMSNNIGYELIDLNGDDVDELVIAMKWQDEWDSHFNRAGYRILNVFTLDEDKAVALTNVYSHSMWFLNADGLFVNEGSSTPAYFWTRVYSFGEGAKGLKEMYSVYNSFVEDSKRVVVYESVDSGEATIIDSSDDKDINELFCYADDAFNKYAENPYALELAPLYDASGNLDEFVSGRLMAEDLSTGNSFYIRDLKMNSDEWDSYSVGLRVDLDNDGVDELILNGPYGGMYLDSVGDSVVVFARGEGTASVLSYVFYDDAYWVVKSDTTHSGRLYYSFTRYNGSYSAEDSFELIASYEGQDHYDENSQFTYRGESISMEEYETLYQEIFSIL